MWNIIEKAVTLYMNVHITYVWITKYRYPVLVGDIGQKTKEVVQEVCGDNQVEIIRGRVASSHVHVYVSVPLYLSISKLVQLIKRKIFRKIQQNFPELKKRYWGKHLWAVGYFVRTSENVTDEMIKNYIENHSKKEDKFGDFQVESQHSMLSQFLDFNP